MQTLSMKQHPEIARIVRAAFPGYKKHNVFLSAFGEHGHSINTYWDGGSRDCYALVDLATGQQRSLPTRTHPYFDVVRAGVANQENEAIAVDHVGNVTLKVLPEGVALVQGGTFCGKPATAHVFLNPANFAKLLPEAA